MLSVECERSKGKPKTKTKKRKEKSGSHPIKAPPSNQADSTSSSSSSNDTRIVRAKLLRSSTNDDSRSSKRQQVVDGISTLANKSQATTSNCEQEQLDRNEQAEQSEKLLVLENEQPFILVDGSLARGQQERCEADRAKCAESNTNKKINCENNNWNIKDNHSTSLNDIRADDCPSNNVDDVKRHFITLIAHNQVQYFYLGVLIFALLTIGFVLAQLLQWSQPKVANRMQPYDCRLQQHYRWLLKPVSRASLWLLLAIILPITIALTLVTALITLQFGQKDYDGQEKQTDNESAAHTKKQANSRGRHRLRKNVKAFGFLFALLLLYSPFILTKISFSSSTFLPPTESSSAIYNVTSLFGHKSECDRSTLEGATSWLSPTVAILMLVYLQPFYLDSSFARRREERRWISWLVCLWCLLLPFASFSFVWWLSRDHSSLEVDETLSTRLDLLFYGLPIALLLGYIKRRAFVCAISEDTFEGATELIEAKVSLEHQRQQQETLLLSVLPAYVAEQVKRNMFKKYTAQVHITGTGSTNELHPHNIDNHLHHHQHQSQQAISLSTSPSTWHQQTHSNQQSLTEASSPRGTKSVSLQQQVTAEEQRKHRTGSIELNPINKPTSSRLRLPANAAQSQPTPSWSNTRIRVGQNPKITSNQIETNLVTSSSTSNTVMPPLPPPTITNTLASSHQVSSRRGFNELYISTYNNVSLLYGDIVGFTRLCTQLSSSQLVRVLNDLFSHFDYLAEKHKIMRIKILGDCYYGVSGIPEFAVMGAKSRANRNDNHATNCVNMGLDMIHYIKCLNIERASKDSQSTAAMSHSASATNSVQSIRLSPTTKSVPDDGSNWAGSKSVGGCTPLPAFELNMRIGIHTGHIHSGVIGLKKWQFDVWSNDVSIAMHCESSGMAGRVQVTEATVQHLNGAFTYENSLASKRDDFLASKDIKTFLICDRVSTLGVELRRQEDLKLENKSKFERKERQQQKSSSNRQDALDELNIRAATIGTIRQTLLAGETCNSSPANIYGLAFNHQDLRPFLLNYRDSTMGKIYSDGRFETDNNNPMGSIDSNSRRILVEFLLTILLLAIIYPLMSIHYLTPRSQLEDGHYFIRSVVVVFIVATLSILVSTFPRDKTRMNEIVVRKTSSSKLSIRPTEGEEKNFLNLDHNDDQLNQSQYVIRDKQFEKNWFTIRLELLNQLRKEIIIIYQKVVHLASILTQDKLVLNKKTASLITILMFIAVIGCQCYLVNYHSLQVHKPKIGSLCTSNQDVFILIAGNLMLSMEQYQLTVIILLVAADVSVKLTSYKTKCILISIALGIQFILYNSGRLLPLDHYQSFNCTENQITANLNRRAEIKSDSIQSSPIAEEVDLSQYDSSHLINQQLIDWFNGALLFVFTLWSLAFARQLDYANKANFLWRNRLNVDHEELKDISDINKILLENILPAHVVQYYMTHPNGQQSADKLPNLQSYMRMSFSNMLSLNNELYHEQHESVTVMFASIPHFYEFYDESDISKQGLGCIALLNEIICDFDKLLLKNKFSRIEKIKTIGSTYMAAAGLRPRSLNCPRQSTCKMSSASPSPTPQFNHQASSTPSWFSKRDEMPNSNHNLDSSSNSLHMKELEKSSLSVQNKLIAEGSVNNNSNEDRNDSCDDRRSFGMSQQKLNLICMIQFATNLMSVLNGINKQSFQVFRLRIGVNTGSVIAGVIGAQRPFYDIWGDCVNIASRMESLGQVGRIQVEERTAKLLMESLCAENYSIVKRGPIDVKGKGGMVTYFVDRKLSNDEQQYRIETIGNK